MLTLYFPPTFSPPSTPRLLSMAEGRLSHSDSRAHENDIQASSLRDQLKVTMDGLRCETWPVAITRQRGSRGWLTVDDKYSQGLSRGA